MSNHSSHKKKSPFSLSEFFIRIAKQTINRKPDWNHLLWSNQSAPVGWRSKLSYRCSLCDLAASFKENPTSLLSSITAWVLPLPAYQGIRKNILKGQKEHTMMSAWKLKSWGFIQQRIQFLCCHIQWQPQTGMELVILIYCHRSSGFSLAHTRINRQSSEF